MLSLDEAVRLASETAGDGDINVAGAGIVRQCLDASVLEEIQIYLAPVLLHEGTRYLDGIKRRGIELRRCRS